MVKTSKRKRLLVILVLYTVSGIAKLRAVYTFGEASALEQVKKASAPMLFIHGSQDNFVHIGMVYELYDACPTRKELFIAEGAGHGQALYLDPGTYFNCVCFHFWNVLNEIEKGE